MDSSLTKIIRPFACSLFIIATLIFTVSVANATAATGPHAYITNSLDNTVSVIDTQTNTVIATVPVEVSPYGVAVNPDGTRIYVTNINPYGSGTVSVIEASTNTVTATVPIGVTPSGVAVNPAGTRIYVTNGSIFGNNTLSVIDAATNTVIATVPVGFGPGGMAVSPDGSRIYVPCYNTTGSAMIPANNGVILVIDAATNKVITTVRVGATPVAVAVNLAGTRIYVANANSDSVSVIDAALLLKFYRFFCPSPV